jgi:hypothetical protein
MSELVSIREAVNRLGVSESVVRRRLRAGSLKGQRQRTPQGHVWLVEVPDQAPPSPDLVVAQSPASRSDPELLAELAAAREAVTRLEAHNADLRTAMAAQQTTVERMEAELVARREEVSRLIVVVREAQRQLAPPLTDSVLESSPSTSRPTDVDQVNDQASTSRMAGGMPWYRRAWSWFNNDQATA